MARTALARVRNACAHRRSHRHTIKAGGWLRRDENQGRRKRKRRRRRPDRGKRGWHFGGGGHFSLTHRHIYPQVSRHTRTHIQINTHIWVYISVRI